MKVPLSKMQCKIGRPRRRPFFTENDETVSLFWGFQGGEATLAYESFARNSS